MEESTRRADKNFPGGGLSDFLGLGTAMKRAPRAPHCFSISRAWLQFSWNHGVSRLKRGGGGRCTCRQYTRDYLNGRVITFLVSPAINTLWDAYVVSCASGTIRKGRRGGGRGVVACFSSSRECLVWERTEIWQGLIKDIRLPPRARAQLYCERHSWLV